MNTEQGSIKGDDLTEIAQNIGAYLPLGEYKISDIDDGTTSYFGFTDTIGKLLSKVLTISKFLGLK